MFNVEPGLPGWSMRTPDFDLSYRRPEKRLINYSRRYVQLAMLFARRTFAGAEKDFSFIEAADDVTRHAGKGNTRLRKAAFTF